MENIRKVETVLAGLFKSVPNLSSQSRQTLTKAWPILALIFGILQLLAAGILWLLLRRAERATDFVNSYSGLYGNLGANPDTFDWTIAYIGIFLLVIQAVTLFVAYPRLKRRENSGWGLLFLVVLINVAYGFVSLFIKERGLADFILSMMASAIGFYLLFQVRDKFRAKGQKAV